jgi:hypothetical protein
MMNKRDEKWNEQHEKMVEFKRKFGHCVVPARWCKHDRSLGICVSTWRKCHDNNTIRLDRKERLEEIGFAWKDVCGFKPDDKKWNKQHEKLLNFKQNKGPCEVSRTHEQDKSLGTWVSTQRSADVSNKLQLDRKRLLDEIGFAWTAEGDDKNDRSGTSAVKN